MMMMMMPVLIGDTEYEACCRCYQTVECVKKKTRVMVWELIEMRTQKLKPAQT